MTKFIFHTNFILFYIKNTTKHECGANMVSTSATTPPQTHLTSPSNTKKKKKKNPQALQ